MSMCSRVLVENYMCLLQPFLAQVFFSPFFFAFFSQHCLRKARVRTLGTRVAFGRKARLGALEKRACPLTSGTKKWEKDEEWWNPYNPKGRLKGKGTTSWARQLRRQAQQPLQKEAENQKELAEGQPAELPKPLEKRPKETNQQHKQPLEKWQKKQDKPLEKRQKHQKQKKKKNMRTRKMEKKMQKQRKNDKAMEVDKEEKKLLSLWKKGKRKVHKAALHKAAVLPNRNK